MGDNRRVPEMDYDWALQSPAEEKGVYFVEILIFGGRCSRLGLLSGVLEAAGDGGTHSSSQGLEFESTC